LKSLNIQSSIENIQYKYGINQSTYQKDNGRVQRAGPGSRAAIPE
jgi:hypothetical protein